MRILLDENLPMRLVATLRALGHDVEHVYTKNLSARPDPDIRATAQSEERFLITQDRRFADTRVFLAGTHPGVLLVRLKSPGRSELFSRIQEIFETNDIESWRGCFVVASDSKLRVRRPPE
jgi:predicted nuclease of predicted toxin-antitoxin system